MLLFLNIDKGMKNSIVKCLRQFWPKCHLIGRLINPLSLRQAEIWMKMAENLRPKTPAVDLDPLDGEKLRIL